MHLTKEQIIAADDRKIVEIDCPEWGGIVRLRTLSGTERDAYEASLFQGEGADRKINIRNLRARLIVLCMVDSEGVRMFDDLDAELLGGKSGVALDPLFDECQKINGLGLRDIEAAREN